MRISDWSSDVCSSDLGSGGHAGLRLLRGLQLLSARGHLPRHQGPGHPWQRLLRAGARAGCGTAGTHAPGVAAGGEGRRPMNGPAITLDIDDGIAWLTLARPEKRNSEIGRAHV